MRFIKKFSVLLAVIMIAGAVAACGSSAPASSSSAADSSSSEAVSSEASSSEAVSSEAVSSEAASSEAAPTGDPMTEEAYKAKVLELFTAVTEKGKDAATVNPEDVEAVLAVMTETMEVAKVSYTEMANLTAPESFAAAQADIKEGVAASLELMDLSLEISKLGEVEMTEEEANKKIADVQAKLAELAPKAEKLNQGLIAVIGADAVAAASAQAGTPAPVQ